MPDQEIMIGAIHIPGHLLPSEKFRINLCITIEDISGANTSTDDPHRSAHTPGTACEETSSIVVKKSAHTSPADLNFPPEVVSPDLDLTLRAIQTPTPRQTPVAQLVQSVQPIARPSTRSRALRSPSSAPVASRQLVPASTGSRRGAFTPSELSTVKTAIHEGKPASDIYPLFTHLSLPQFKMRYSRLKQKLQERS